MKYPNISDYNETLQNPERLFRTIKNINPLRDNFGDLNGIAGNYSVVYEVLIEDKRYALKCYTKYDNLQHKKYNYISEYLTKNRSKYFIDFLYLEDEVLVFDIYDKARYYPVLLMEMVEGKTLGKYLQERCHNNDQEAIRKIAEKFGEMALWLLNQEIAHCDLKCDNIIVTQDGDLKLLDYDGFYVPKMRGNISTELGTRSYQHPLREKILFNRHTDDYSIALIFISIHTFAEFPSYFKLYNDGENLIFDPVKLVSNRCELIRELKEIWLMRGDNLLCAVAGMLSSKTPILDNLRDTISAFMRSKTIENNSFPEFDDCDIEIIRKNRWFGFRNKITTQLTDIIYDEVSPFSEGLAAVSVAGGNYYIDHNFNMAINCRNYTEIYSFKENLAVVKLSTKYGYIDKTGAMIIEPQFDQAQNFSEGLAAVCIDKKFGFINHNGTFVIDPNYDYVFSFKEGFAVVGNYITDGDKTIKRFGYINQLGELVTKIEFEIAHSFRDGKAEAERAGNKYMLVKYDNNTIYEDIYTIS